MEAHLVRFHFVAIVSRMAVGRVSTQSVTGSSGHMPRSIAGLFSGSTFSCLRILHTGFQQTEVKCLPTLLGILLHFASYTVNKPLNFFVIQVLFPFNWT